ncbi:hypothetical protein [Streptomyces rimosus]|uniref:hypothetical protein n=1 Tax=Streptomyces rimosus TaxID=1927 RepID=UPI0004C4A3D6|nr:hypothetical protein [Streptomyces rimosus]
MTTPETPETPICEVRQEAGREHDALGARIAALAETAAPVVEAVTGLPLPVRPLLRLVTVEALIATRREHTDAMMHRLRGEGYGQQLVDEAEFARARERFDNGERGLAANWKNIQAISYEDARMRPQILIIARSVVHHGHDDDQLLRTIAHELTHLAQHRATGGRALDFVMSPYGYGMRMPGTKELAHCAARFLIEGHASWADHQVTTQLIGQPLGWHTDPTTDEQRATKRLYDDGCAFVATAIDQVGLESFNATWRHLRTSCPVETEVDDVTGWLRRNYIPTPTMAASPPRE